jgi:hypothetical protein
MAEEGNAVNGSEISGTPDSVEYLSTHHISSYEEMKADNVAQSQRATLGWTEAVSRDERAQNRQGESAPSTRSPASQRAMYRTQQEWRRTVRGVRRQTHAQLQEQHPTPMYAKGREGSLLGKLWIGFFRFLGVD